MVWVNGVGNHFKGTPYGGYKNSGIGRRSCLSELVAATTEEKSIEIFAGEECVTCRRSDAFAACPAPPAEPADEQVSDKCASAAGLHVALRLPCDFS